LEGEGALKNFRASAVAILLYSSTSSFLERLMEATTTSFCVQEARSGYEGIVPHPARQEMAMSGMERPRSGEEARMKTSIQSEATPQSDREQLADLECPGAELRLFQVWTPPGSPIHRLYQPPAA
jgi:hypothetical protein